MYTVLKTPGLRVHQIHKVAHSSINIVYRDLPIKFERATPEEEGDELRFMVVRHPLDRIVSAWSFFCNRERRLETIFYDLGYRREMSFPDFFQVCLQKHEENEHTMKQIHFTGGHEIDWLCPMEELNEHWERLRQEFDYLPKMVHENPSVHEDWRKYYTDEMRFEGERIFTKDLELYNKAKRGRDN